MKLNALLKKIGIILLILSIITYVAGISIQATMNGKEDIIKVNELLSSSTTVSKKLYGDSVISASAVPKLIAAMPEEGDWIIGPEIRLASAIESIARNTDTIAMDEDAKAEILVGLYENRDKYFDENYAVNTEAVLADAVTGLNTLLTEETAITEDVQKTLNRKLNVLKNTWADEDAADPAIATASVSVAGTTSLLNTFTIGDKVAWIGVYGVIISALILLITALTKQRMTGKVLKGFLRTDEITTLIPLLVIIAITTIFRPDFLTVKNFSAMFTQIPFIAICALGASFPLMVGNVDISTGRVAGFAGILMAVLVIDYGWSTAPAILVALAACIVIGLWNGFLVVKMDIPDFVATMGTLYIIGGARYLFIHGYELTLGRVENFHLDEIFDARYMGMPLYFWIMLLLFAILFVVIKKMVWGRKLLATGDNREVANIVGINANKMRMTAYSICSFLAGIAGILLVLDTSFAKPEYGDGWEFRAIAGCVVGGVSLSGGKCSPLGILIGVTLVFVAENAIIFLGLPSTMREAVKGFLMAAAVLFDIFRNSRKVSA